ncbi:MAG: deoxyribonuclease IV [Deltaproteobacteria bacterium]|nr:deoxyribonuclease IV [Deltaproteobacteria bacterium]MBI3293361.1 deoxyribonuclease IV [Deltaproteobacteria bacterium]
MGAHISIAGGVDKAIERGEKLGCDAIQIFTQSSRTWKCFPIAVQTQAAFRTALKTAKRVKRVVAHNSYLLNLSTTDSVHRKQSVRFFIDIMNQCESLGIESLITHPGSHKGEGLAAGIRATVQSLNEVMKACAGFETRILMENTAGQGDCIGHRFEELRSIVSATSDPDRIGFCFDTQHAFAAGYDLRTQADYEATFDQFERLLGIKKIGAFHLNDAVKEFGSRVDRHANIGEGFLGKEPFQFLLNDKRFRGVPMCLETDPGEDDRKHKKDLKTLRSLVSR